MVELLLLTIRAVKFCVPDIMISSRKSIDTSYSICTKL